MPKEPQPILLRRSADTKKKGNLQRLSAHESECIVLNVIDQFLGIMYLQYSLIAVYKRKFGQLPGFLRVVLLPLTLTLLTVLGQPLEAGILPLAFFITWGTLSEHIIDRCADRKQIC